MPLVFQYGSNCTAARINGPKRLNGNAEVLGRAHTVEDCDITFDVYSQTNGCAAADLILSPGRKAWGILYEIPEDFIRDRRADGQKTLEQIEGPNYQERPIRVADRDGTERDAVTFVVKANRRHTGLWTSAEYVEYIVKGLRTHQVSEEYVQHLIDVAIETNCHAAQSAAEQNQLIQSLRTPSP